MVTLAPTGLFWAQRALPARETKNGASRRSNKERGREIDGQVVFGQLQNFLLPCPVIGEMSDSSKTAPEGGYTT